jgi:hypothetical protein
MDYPSVTYQLVREVLAKDKTTLTFNCAGNSMRPLICVGDKLQVRSATFESLFPGDIAVFQSQSYLCAHRFMRAYGTDGNRMLVTKSDLSTKADEPFSYTHLVGKVVAIQKKNYYIDLESFPWKTINTIIAIPELSVFFLRKALKKMKCMFPL